MAQSAKKSAQQILDRLPEDAGWDQIMYEFYVKQKIERSLAEAAIGRVVPHEDVRRELLGDAD
jgi:predicted transcriptional regulator